MKRARLSTLKRKALIRWWYLRHGDHAAYQRAVRARIDDLGPTKTIGGTDNGVGDLQFEFLRDHGLSPSNQLLDFGCGTLRGGQRFIDYLDAGQYVGVDMSRALLVAGRDQLSTAALAKDPALVVGDDLGIVASRSFDVGVAQSVLSHFSKPRIREFFEGVSSVLVSDGVFYATFFDELRPRPQDHGHDEAWVRSAAQDAGLDVTVFEPDEYDHPYDQRMMALQAR